MRIPHRQSSSKQACFVLFAALVGSTCVPWAPEAGAADMAVAGLQVATDSRNPAATGTWDTHRKDKSSLIVTRDYIIGPEDVLEVMVWRNQDLSKLVAVRPDGRITLPLIGDVMAVGKTPAELTELISRKMKEYKENPTVAIEVREVNSYAIFVLGEVTRPGKYPLKSKTTLLQALTVAGGFTPIAARNKLAVFRFGTNDHGDDKIKASYDDIVLRDGIEQNIELKPGDTIVVPSETMVMIP